MSNVGVGAFAVAAIFLLAALLVRYAGNARVLNIVDYSRVTDARELHRWAGKRLVLAALGTACMAAATWLYPHLAMSLLFGQVLVLLAGVLSVASGVSKFQRPITKSAA